MDQSSGVKQESAQSQSMTFVENNMGAEELNPDQTESRRLTDKMLTRSKRNAAPYSTSNNESSAYKDLKQKLVSQAAMTEEEMKSGKNETHNSNVHLLRQQNE